MLFNQTIDAMAEFTSVQLYNKIQEIKKIIIEDIANGNGTNDSTYISREIKVMNEEISLIYKGFLTFDLSDPEKYYEDSNEVMNKLMRLYNDEIISIKKTNIDYQNELKTSNYYIYKTITWRIGELFREVEVVRYKDKSRGVTPTIVQKFNESSKNNLDDRRKTTSLYVGPMDIAFYSFYSPKYFLKNSFIIHELIKFERIIHKRIMFELDYIFANHFGKYDYINNEFTWMDFVPTPQELEENIKDYYIGIYQKRYGKYFNPDYAKALNLLQETWEVWKERHNLFFDYFMAIQFLENDCELNEQMGLIEKLKKQSKTLPEEYQFKIDFLTFENENNSENHTEIKEFYTDIRDQFFNRYTAINKEIKSLHKELAKIK
ncbi:hypothetical protein ACIQYL_20770 [Lysinibacillus xylanilyticus]|uniref:hypothetical protein n=1 Tax=Lysinibacillus xylanilyticus TaxID=582475 RepID=UPI003806D3E0